MYIHTDIFNYCDKKYKKEITKIVQSDILDKVLKEKDMSQAQLAKKSGVSENTISR